MKWHEYSPEADELLLGCALLRAQVARIERHFKVRHHPDGDLFNAIMNAVEWDVRNLRDARGHAMISEHDLRHLSNYLSRL